MFNPKKEKRKFKRYNVDGIHGNMIYSTDFNVVNISIDGTAIETTKRLNIGNQYSLKIKYRDDVLNIKGVVVWSILKRTETRKTGEAVPVYKAGIRFTNILSENSTGLLKFIEENRTETIEKRLLGVRFKINKIEDAEINCPHEYTVKKLSLSGMLIESENLFDVDSAHEMEIYFDEKLLSVVGRVVNCVEFKKENISKYDIGIEFIRISEKDRLFLKDFLEAFNDKEDRD
ncbi:MAG: PilZ domain-containing protein [Nitrospirota bacterium]